MGVAHTPNLNNVVLADIDASSSFSLRESLHLAAGKAGWRIHTPVLNGYVYDIVSPQPEAVNILLAKVRIQDTGRKIGAVNCIDIQFLDYNEDRAGFSHYLRYEPDLTLKLHMTPCQFIVWLPGDTSTIATVVMGGIPWVPPLTLSANAGDCSTETPSATFTERAWWSIGDFGDGLYCPTFRTSYRPDPIRNWSMRWNGFFRNAALGTADPEGPGGVHGPRLFPETNTFGYYDAGNDRLKLGKMCWYGSDLSGNDNNLPLYLDPLTGWSINAEDNYPYVIGQLWDSVIVSTERSDAQEIVFDGLRFFNFTAPGPNHDSWFSSLFLRRPDLTNIEPEVANIAY